MTDLPALDRYRAHADRLGKRFQSLTSEHVLRSIVDYLPDPPADILDVGAGSGRDACRFARDGHRITAAEPVKEMWALAADLPGADRVEWIDDHLPTLAKLEDRTFDLCLLSGVWHHLPEIDRPKALTRLTELLKPNGRLVLSLRIGPDTDGITNIAIDTERTIRQAAETGLTLLHQTTTQSNNPKNIALGVTWDWLVLERESSA